MTPRPTHRSPLTPSAPPRRSPQRSATAERQPHRHRTPPPLHTSATDARAAAVALYSFSDSRSPGPPTHLPNPPLVHHQPSSLFGPRPRSRTPMVRGRGRGPNRPPPPVSIGQQQPLTPDPRSGVQSGGKSTPECPGLCASRARPRRKVSGSSPVDHRTTALDEKERSRTGRLLLARSGRVADRHSGARTRTKAGR
jgi:hypothetical protein